MTALTFRDHFSERAREYAAYRPRYPDALIDYIARLPDRRSLALDCGTGNGQAAVGLAERFDRVVATDRSQDQLRHAIAATNVEYRCAAAEDSGLPDASVDLITAAQALHWFDTAAFFDEARRALVPGGVIAVWGYGDPTIAEPALHAIIHEFNRGFLEAYWPTERSLLLDRYATIEFPFDEIASPAFELHELWSFAELTGYLRSWSAVARYAAEHGRDPVVDLEKKIEKHWRNPVERCSVRWPLYLRVGRKSASG